MRLLSTSLQPPLVHSGLVIASQMAWGALIYSLRHMSTRDQARRWCSIRSGLDPKRESELNLACHRKARDHVCG